MKKEITEEKIDWFKEVQPLFEKELEYGRRSGQTTALSFHYIAYAIKNPGIIISITDHYGSRDARLNLLDQIISVIEREGLTGFGYNINLQSIVFILSPKYYLKNEKGWCRIDPKEKRIKLAKPFVYKEICKDCINKDKSDEIVCRRCELQDFNLYLKNEVE